MTTISLHVDILVQHDDDAARLFDLADSLMESLLELEGGGGIGDSSVSADSGKRLVEVEILSDGEDLEDAVSHGMAAIRTAIHKTGGSTPGWEFINIDGSKMLQTA